mgnify:CR=1 FL=1
MKEAVRQSVEAGLNVRCTFRSPESYVLPLRELIQEGGLSMETIDNRVRDILRVKFLTGLFDTPYQTNLALADKEVNSKAHQASRLTGVPRRTRAAEKLQTTCFLWINHKSSVLPYVVQMLMKHRLHLPTTVP